MNKDETCSPLRGQSQLRYVNKTFSWPSCTQLFCSFHSPADLLSGAYHSISVNKSSVSLYLPPAAILDDQSVCGRGERLALALARENINSLMEGSSQARVEVDVYELQKDSQYDTTDTSKTPSSSHHSQLRVRRVNRAARTCSVKLHLKYAHVQHTRVQTGHQMLQRLTCPL